MEKKSYKNLPSVKKHSSDVENINHLLKIIDFGRPLLVKLGVDDKQIDEMMELQKKNVWTSKGNVKCGRKLR